MLACPACGEVAPPGIVVPHDRWYECPSCGERTPRAELDPLRLKSVFRGGAQPPRLLLTLVSTASMTDGLQNTLTIVSGSFSVVAGDLLVAYLTSWAGSDDVGVGAATVSNGEGAMTVQLYAGVNAGLAGVLLSRNISTTGTRTITIQFNNIPLPKSATLAVYRLRLAGYTLGSGMLLNCIVMVRVPVVEMFFASRTPARPALTPAYSDMVIAPSPPETVAAPTPTSSDPAQLVR